MRRTGVDVPNVLFKTAQRGIYRERYITITTRWEYFVSNEYSLFTFNKIKMLRRQRASGIFVNARATGGERVGRDVLTMYISFFLVLSPPVLFCLIYFNWDEKPKTNKAYQVTTRRDNSTTLVSPAAPYISTVAIS